MSRRIEYATESKKTKKNWLLTTVDPSLGFLSTLPNHVLMSLVLMHLNGKELALISGVSKSYSGVITEFRKTAAGQENLEKFLKSELNKLGKKLEFHKLVKKLEFHQLAKKQKTELKDMPMPEALSAVEHVIEVKRSRLTSRARVRQSSIYECAIALLCMLMSSGGGGGGAGSGESLNCSRKDPLSPRSINVLRVIFILLCAASAFGLYREMGSGKQDDNTHYLTAISGATMGITGLALLIDIVQSLYNCCQQREVNEEKSQVSFLRNMHSSIYSSGNYSSINDESKTSEVISSHYVALGNGNG